MPGVDLGLVLPTLADTMADIVAKTSAALSAIEDDLAGLVTPSEMNINGTLSMNGAYLTNAGAIQFLAGNSPTSPGSIYFSGGELWAIDNVGPVQITESGGLNAALLGSIVGDYGGGNGARVTYVDFSGEYDFTEDPGVWADLAADDLVLHSATGSVRFGVANTITTARQFLIGSLPTSGVSFLVYNAATSTVEDGSTTPVTSLSVATLAATTSFTTPSAALGDLSYSGNFTHSVALTQSIDLSPAAHTWLNNGAGGSLTLAENNRLSATFYAGNSIRLPAPMLSPGDRVDSITVGYTGHAPASVALILDPGSSTPSVLATTPSTTYTVTTGGGVLLTYCQYAISGTHFAVPKYSTAAQSIPVAGNVSVKITAGGTPTIDTIAVYNVDITFARISVASVTSTLT